MSKPVDLKYAVTGDPELDSNMAKLTTAMQKKNVVKAMQVGMKRILRAIVGGTPTDTGQLQKSITYYLGKNTGRQIFLNIGPDLYKEKKKIYRKKAKLLKRKKKVSQSYIRKQLIRMDSNALLKFLERGVKHWKGKKKGQWMIPPMGWVRRAYDVYGADAARTIVQVLKEFIDNEMLKLATVNKIGIAA